MFRCGKSARQRIDSYDFFGDEEAVLLVFDDGLEVFDELLYVAEHARGGRKSKRVHRDYGITRAQEYLFSSFLPRRSSALPPPPS